MLLGNLNYRNKHRGQVTDPSGLSKTDLPFIGLRNTLFIFDRKMVICLFCGNTSSDFSLPFLNCSSHRAEKDDCKEKIVRCTAWELLIESPRSFLDKLFFKLKYKNCFIIISSCWSQTISIILGEFTALQNGKSKGWLVFLQRFNEKGHKSFSSSLAPSLFHWQMVS